MNKLLGFGTQRVHGKERRVWGFTLLGVTIAPWAAIDWEEPTQLEVGISLTIEMDGPVDLIGGLLFKLFEGMDKQ